MSFPCPVEACTSVYEDWETLKDHLKETHSQDTDLKTYDEWRSSVEPMNTETGQQQQRNMQQNREQTEPQITPLERALSPSVTSDTSLSCPDCGKVFDRGTLMSSFNSVKMHAVKSHGKQLQPSDFGLETDEGGRPSPPGSPQRRMRRRRASSNPWKQKVSHSYVCLMCITPSGNIQGSSGYQNAAATHSSPP